MIHKLDSPRFGTLEYSDQQILEFPDGMLGFPDLRRFLHLSPEDMKPLQFLLAVEQPQLSFPLLNPYLVRPDYGFELSASDRTALGLGQKADVAVYCQLAAPATKGVPPGGVGQGNARPPQDSNRMNRKH